MAKGLLWYHILLLSDILNPSKLRKEEREKGHTVFGRLGILSSNGKEQIRKLMTYQWLLS